MDDPELIYYVRNWWKYQHYSDRRPPWIKLHRSIETDPDFQSLSESNQWRLVKFWLLASDLDGTWRGLTSYLTRTWRLHKHSNTAQVLAEFESRGLISKEDVRGLKRSNASPSQRQRQSREENKEQVQKQAPKNQEPVFELPTWIPSEEWAGYLEMRVKIKKPMTARAMRLAVRVLDGLRDHGENPTAVLNQSIMNSWQGLFPISNGGNGNGRSKSQQQFDSTKRILEDFSRRHN